MNPSNTALAQILLSPRREAHRETLTWRPVGKVADHAPAPRHYAGRWNPEGPMGKAAIGLIVGWVTLGLAAIIILVH